MTEKFPTRFFTTHPALGRGLYRLYFSIFLVGLFSLFYYRLTLIPSGHRLLWLSISLAEFGFAIMWLFQQGFRWAPTRHITHPDRLPSDLPPIDVMLCTADPEREPADLVANTLLSLMAYDYDVRKLAYYVSDDGGSELTFHATYQASVFARDWLPFCRKYNIEPRSPQAFFSATDDASFSANDTAAFQQDYIIIKKKLDEMQESIMEVGKSGKVREDTRRRHKGFREWKSMVNPRNHQSIVEVLLRGNGGDIDADGKPMPTLVYVSREKRPDHPHHYKAGALNALNRVSALMSNAPFIINVDCDMYSNNSQVLRHAMCFFLDSKESHRIAYVQFPQCFDGLTENDLYSNNLKRIFDVEKYGENFYSGTIYSGTGAVHRRESLNGRKFNPGYQPQWDGKLVVGGNNNWSELEEKARDLTSCSHEQGKLWGKEMGLIYGCATEDVLTGLTLHLRGWKSVYCTPERKGFLGLAPINLNDTLIQHKRWATGLLEIFISGYCPLTSGIGRMSWAQIMSYSYYCLWAAWSLPILCYALLPPIAMVKAIPLFPKASDPWFKMFAFLGIASHAYSLAELIRAKGTFKMWWNETRMWLMKGVTSYFMGLIAVVLKQLGFSEPGFEITSKVSDEEVIKRYKQEVMEFGLASPMFVPPSTLSLLNLFCFLKSTTMIAKDGLSGFDGMALQIILSGYITIISLPLYEAMFLRRDKGRMPTSLTVYSTLLALALFYLLPHFI